MQKILANQLRVSLFAGIGALALSLAAAPASAQGVNASAAPGLQRTASAGSTGTHAAPAAQRTAKPYFIEFRARSALSYGHTFAVHGRNGTKITAQNVVGLHPATESSVPWMIGHVLLVPSETGASDGDTEEQYVIARYRVPLSEAEYRKLMVTINEMRANSPVWHAVLYNCNAFVADMAKSLGLRTPSSTMQMPKEFITELRDLNTGKKQTASASGQPY